MRRLGGGMNHGVDGATKPDKQRFDLRSVPDVEALVRITLQARFQLASCPSRRSIRAKELSPHIVINSNHVETFVVKLLAGLGADQSGCTSNYGNAHKVALSVWFLIP